MAKRKRSSPKEGPAWRAAKAYGCDMSLIECNLRKTPLQRIRENDRMIALVLRLRKAMERAHARS